MAVKTTQLEALILAKTRRVVVTGDPGDGPPPRVSSTPWPCARASSAPGNRWSGCRRRSPAG